MDFKHEPQDEVHLNKTLGKAITELKMLYMENEKLRIQVINLRKMYYLLLLFHYLWCFGLILYTNKVWKNNSIIIQFIPSSSQQFRLHS